MIQMFIDEPCDHKIHDKVCSEEVASLTEKDAHKGNLVSRQTRKSFHEDNVYFFNVFFYRRPSLTWETWILATFLKTRHLQNLLNQQIFHLEIYTKNV